MADPVLAPTCGASTLYDAMLGSIERDEALVLRVDTAFAGAGWLAVRGQLATLLALYEGLGGQAVVVIERVGGAAPAPPAAGS